MKFSVDESLRDSCPAEFPHFNAALIPAMVPCPPASSYPVVPLTCPAKNSPSITFDSSEWDSCVGSKKSYSMA